METNIFVVIFLFKAALVTSQCVFTCPQCDGFFPDPTDCTKYYQCANCVVYPGQCQPGLEWDPNIDSCNWPSGECRTTPDPCYSTPPGLPESTTESTLETTTSAPVPGIALGVGLDRALSGEANPVLFTLKWIDRNERYEDGLFKVPKTSHYYISLSAGALNETGINYQLQRNALATHSLTRSSTSHNGIDTTSRDLIVELREGDEMSISSSSAGLHSDLEVQTSWCLMDIEDVFDHTITAFVGRNQPLSGSADPLPFNAINVNPGQHYDAVTHTFTVPENGSYYMSISAGVDTPGPVKLTLRINNNAIATLERTSTTHTGTDTLSRATMRNLGVGDVIKVVQDAGTSWADSTFQTSLSIIKYEPDTFSAVSWSLARTTAWYDPDNFIFPIPYDQVLVHEGNVLNQERDTVTLSATGYYWIHMSTGAVAGRGVNYSLLRNGAAIGDCYRTASNYNGIDTLSRSAIVRLEAGDVLQMGANSGTSVYSDASGLHASFIGFLVYPD